MASPHSDSKTALQSAASLEVMSMMEPRMPPQGALPLAMPQPHCRRAPRGGAAPSVMPQTGSTTTQQGEDVASSAGRTGSKATRARNERRRRQKARLRGEDAVPEKQQHRRETEVLNYNSHRLLRVLAVRDAFSAAPLDKFSLEVLMRRTWAYLDEPLIWQVESGADEWMDFNEDSQSALTSAAASGDETLVIRGGNWMYHIDLAAMTQANLSSHKVRKIRCSDPYARAFRPSLPRHQPVLTRPTWQFKTGHGWADCKQEIQQVLETAQVNGEAMVFLSDLGYEMDLQGMTQTNILSGRQRQLRRLDISGQPQSREQ